MTMLSTLAFLALAACGGEDATPAKASPWDTYGEGQCREYVKYICTCHKRNDKERCVSLKRQLVKGHKSLDVECGRELAAQKRVDKARRKRCQ